jgi:acyl-CoA thioester hydrolase
MDYAFQLEFDVRDYECDLTGVVNNAVYQHYLEHTRHVFLKQAGIDFAALAQQGIVLVVTRIELDFLCSLRSGDRFQVCLNLERVSRLRFGFKQDIYHLPDGKPILKGRVIGTALNAAGRPYLPVEFERIMATLTRPAAPVSRT